MFFHVKGREYSHIGKKNQKFKTRNNIYIYIKLFSFKKRVVPVEPRPLPNQIGRLEEPRNIKFKHTYDVVLYPIEYKVMNLISNI